MEHIEIEIVNWRKHQRKDVKKPSWFAMDNRILEDSKLFDLSDGEWKALLYIFSQASQQRSEMVRINLGHAKRVCGIPEKVVKSTISRLNHAGVTRTSRGRHADVTPQDRTGQDKTGQHVTPPGGGLPPIALIWNERTKSLPKVKDWTKAREKAAGAVLKARSLEEWSLACERTEASEFLSGRSEKWTHCSFDWLTKPANLIKVLEGNYENRNGTDRLTGGWAEIDGTC